MNVVVSAGTMLIVLWIWGRGTAPAVPTPTPTLDSLSRVASAVPTFTATVPPSPTPVTYTVQPGDTLGAIASNLGVSTEELMAANGMNDPDTLAVGQVLIVPQVEGVEEPATQTPVAVSPERTVTPAADAEAPRVEIRGVNGVGDLEEETVRLLNTGGVANMARWTLDDSEGRVYVFPAFTLHRGAVSVHTKSGTDTVIDLYWGLTEAVWLPGKIITLRDAAGNVQSTFEIPES